MPLHRLELNLGTGFFASTLKAMYCLRWWLPIFILPFPAAPPAFLILFLVSYALSTRPCPYCGAIVLGLVLSSCYFTTPHEPKSLTIPDAWVHTRVGFGFSRFLDWIMSSPSPGASQHIPPSSSCSTCWTDLGVGQGRGFFVPMPRHPYCESGVSYPSPKAPSTLFIGVPGTALGFELDWSLFIKPA